MSFDSDSGATAGSKSSRKGIPNKDNSRRQWISDFIDNYTPGQFIDDFDKLTPTERVKVVLKLMEFDTAKMKAMELKQIDTPYTVRVVYVRPDKPKSIPD